MTESTADSGATVVRVEASTVDEAKAAALEQRAAMIADGRRCSGVRPDGGSRHRGPSATFNVKPK